MGAPQPQILPRVTFISQGMGRIEPPRANGSIAIWTYGVSRHLIGKFSVLLVELGDQPFGLRLRKHEGATYLYLPSAWNRILNKTYRIAATLGGLLPRPKRGGQRPSYASVFHNLGYIAEAAWHARRWRSDIIHIHNFAQFAAVVRVLNPRAHIVLHMHAEWLSQHDPDMIARRLKHTDTIFCCSGHVMRRLLERFPGLENKVRVVFNGCDVERFTPREEQADSQAGETQRVLFVGRISPEKGVHNLMHAFAALAARRPDVQLDLVGGAGSLPADFLVDLSHDPLVKKLARFYKSDYLGEVKRRIPEHLQDRVMFHGNIGHDEIGAHYRHASVFVCPSLSDAFPLTVVEAMAAGLPVVASKVGGIPEAVVDGETGVLVEPDNPEALSHALLRLLDDSALRKRMGAAGRERALRLFSWQAIGSEVASIYFQAVSNHEFRRL